MKLVFFCELGIITNQGFNNLMGYHNTCISCFRDLFKLLNRYRLNDGITQAMDSLQNMKVLSDFYQQTTIVYIDSKGIIPESGLHKYTPGLPIEEIRVGEKSFWLLARHLPPIICLIINHINLDSFLSIRTN